MVVGGRGSPRCGQPVGRRSRTGPCMSGQFDVGWRACGVFMVTSCPLQWFCWCAVVLVASWSVYSALVPWRCSGRLRSRICCVQVFCLLRCWLVPVAWGRLGTVLLCAVCPPWGRKVMISGLTAVKTFFKFGALFPAPPWQRCMHNPSSGTLRCSVAVLPVTPVAFICTPPVGGKAPPVPLGASLCSPWEPKGAVPARWCGARARVCLPAVRHIVPCFAGHVAGVPVLQC